MEIIQFEVLKKVITLLLTEDVIDRRVGHDVENQHVDDAEERFEDLLYEVVQRTIEASRTCTREDVRTTSRSTH